MIRKQTGIVLVDFDPLKLFEFYLGVLNKIYEPVSAQKLSVLNTTDRHTVVIILIVSDNVI
jgi:hypothetical protein